jgi:hypothetical protein
MRHVFGSCVCRWFTCLIMFVVLVYLKACVLSLISFKFKFSYISTRVVIYHQKGGDCNHLGPFAALVRVCFGDK